ncbi:MAG: amidohydrolase family protein [bacterium]
MTTRSAKDPPLDRLLTGGTYVLGGGSRAAALGIRDGRVAWTGAAEEAPPAGEVMDLTGKLILPGAVDPHVHFRTFSSQCDTLGDVSRSGAHGGVTTLVAYATGEEDESMLGALRRCREEGEADCVADFSLHAWIFEDFDYLAEIPKAVDAGVTSFKVMMGYRKRGRGRCIPDEYTYAAMERAAGCGGIVLVHAENGPVVDYLENKALAEGIDGAEYLRRSRPPEIEAEAVARSAHLAALAGCPLYIVHVTSAAALTEVRRAQADGRDLVAETCPQYLTITDDAVAERGAIAKVAPPLRSQPNIDALWEGVREGSIDLIGSDHSPYTQAQKEEASFTASPFGAPGIETLLPVLYSEGAATGRISLDRLVQIASEFPARVLGLHPWKGNLHPGADADIVVIDPEGETIVRAADQHTNSDYSLLEGRTLKGRIEMTLVRGEVVVREGVLEKKPGFGHFIDRRRAGGRAALSEAR